MANLNFAWGKSWPEWRGPDGRAGVLMMPLPGLFFMKETATAWMNALKEAWNTKPEVRGRLEEIGFNSTLICGFKDEDAPPGVFVVENGTCVRAGGYDGTVPDWDMRATQDHWKKWADEGIGMAGLGTMFAMAKLKFMKGGFAAMIKDPRMAGPFVKNFALMGQIHTD